MRLFGAHVDAHMFGAYVEIRLVKCIDTDQAHNTCWVHMLRDQHMLVHVLRDETCQMQER